MKMKKAFGRAPLAKSRRQLNRTMGKMEGMTKRVGVQKDIRKMKREMPWKNMIALIGGAIGLAAFMVIGRSQARSQKEKSLAQSGQAPGRSHVQMSSHPAAQSRYQPTGRQFGSQQEQR